MNTLGLNIKRLRSENNYNQKELADVLNVSQTSIAHYEAGTRQPSLETLTQISQLFQVSVDSLLNNKLKNTFTDSVDDVHLTDTLVDVLLAKDEKKFFEIFHNNLYKQFELKHILNSIYKDVLYKIGYLWETGVISEADEHYATNLIRKTLHYMSIQNSTTIKVKSAVSFLVSREYHTIGIEMVNTYLEHLGIKTHYLGSDLPSESIIKFIREQQPDYIFISITLDSYINNLLRLVKSLRTEFKTPIYIGGQGIINKTLLDFENVHIVQTLEEIDSYIK